MLPEDAVTFNYSAARCSVCVQQHGTANYPRPSPTATPDTNPPALRQCTACRLIGYCGESHQKADWRDHRHFCRAISHILKTRLIGHILDLCGPIHNSSHSFFQQARINARAVLCVALGRQLTAHETAAINFPRLCHVCYYHEWHSLILCSGCEMIFTCRPPIRHNPEVVGRLHDECECENLRLHRGLVICGILPPLARPQLVRPGAPPGDFPITLFDMINRSVSGWNFTCRPVNDDEYREFSQVCNFSFVATILAALHESGILLTYTAGHSALRVHVVGAESEVVLFTEHECWLLVRWLPARFFCTLLEFVGPNMPAELNGVQREYHYGERTVRCKFHRMPYELLNTEGRDPPDMCIAFNAGITEHALSTSDDPPPPPGEPDPQQELLHSSWVPALQRILKSCRCFAMTAYVFDENKEDFRFVLRLAQGLKKKLNVTSAGLNLMRDWRPHRNVLNEKVRLWPNEVEYTYFLNGFMSVMTIADEEDVDEVAMEVVAF